VNPLRILGIVLLLVALVRLGSLCRRFAVESLQADFAAYYTAGEAVRAGMSPYDNGLTATPQVWDGIARYRHSRFLYPPLVARILVPLTFLPYDRAKLLWMAMSIAAVIGSLVIASRVPGRRLPIEALLIVATFALLFFPLTVLLERGQIDAFTLLPLTAGTYLISTRPDREWVGGFLIGTACLIKPHIILAFPFFFLRGRWKAAGGMAVAVLVFASLSVVAGGRDEVERYVTVDLPRIGTYAEFGTAEMMLPDSVVSTARSGLAEDEVVKDGHLYRRSTLDFAPGASLVRLVSGIPKRLGISASLPVIALLLTLGSAGALWVVCRKRTDRQLPLSPRREFLFWQIVAVLLLIFGPLTWMMNLVWLLPASVMLVGEVATLPRTAPRWAVITLAAGMLLTALPEFGFLAMPDIWLQTKYVLAEIAVLAGLWGIGGGCAEPGAR
jgi:hypothetical protein